jgi:DNA-binding transcriptional regulator GbsR (MarR family)
MTEITVDLSEKKSLPAAIEQFVLSWGDLGGHWGVNRSIAQIHALLYVSDQPMTAEEIADCLDIARSNVSTSIRELLSWKLIHRVPIRGDRRDHFEAETDLWEVAILIAEGRKQREIDPARVALQACAKAARADAQVSPAARERLTEMESFVTDLSSWYSDMLTLPRSNIVALVKLGSRVARFLKPTKRK